MELVILIIESIAKEAIDTERVYVIMVNKSLINEGKIFSLII